MNYIPTFTSHISSYTRDKKISDPYWTRYVLRPLSFPVSWFLDRIGFTANGVTYASIGIALLAALFLTFQSWRIALLGAILFNIFALLDCVDGNIARAKKSDSAFGGWIDALGGYIAYSAVFLSMGIASEKMKSELSIIPDQVDFIVLGAATAIMNLLMRVEYQHFRNLQPEDVEYAGGLQRRIGQNIGITGFLMPLLVIGMVWRLLPFIVIFYTAFFALAWIVVTIRLIQKVKRLDQEGKA